MLKQSKTHTIKWLVLAFFAALLLYMGIWKGIWQIQSDFPNYYVGSKLLVEGKLQEAYDAGYFQSYVSDYIKDAQGLFLMYPPGDALLMLPVSFFSPHTARIIWLILSLIFLFLLIKEFSYISLLDFYNSAFIILSGGFIIINDIYLGQIYIFVTFLILAGWRKHKQSKDPEAMLYWAFAATLKFVPIFFIPVLVYAKKYKACGYFVLFFILFNSQTFLLSGADTYLAFFKSFKEQYINGKVAGDIALSLQYQSVEVWINRLVDDTLWVMSLEASILRSFWLLICTGIVVISCLKGKITQFRTECCVGVIIIILLWIEKGSASYHLLFLLLPMALVFRTNSEKRNSKANILMQISWVLTGILPWVIQKTGLSGGAWDYCRLLGLLITGSILIYMLNSTKNETTTVLQPV